MYEIKVRMTFSAAHNLLNYKGKCEKLHGHNWNVEAAFSYKKLGKDGMAIDFHDAKKLLRDVLEKFDHTYLNEIKPFNKISPTTENVSRYIFEALRRENPHIVSIAVWENENSCATYRGK